MTVAELEPLVLSDQERQILEGWSGRPTAQPLVLRSRIVLASADGAPISAVADQLGIARATAAKWRSRFLRNRLGGLADKPRPGRPRTITDAQVETVIATTLEQAPPDGTAWSTRSMARQAGMSQTAISRIWRAFGLSTSRKSINDSDHDRGPSPDRMEPAYAPRRTAMLAAERRDLFLARLRRDGKLIARDLARELGLSEDSVRRDLRDLAAAGLCQRVYGGALPVSPAAGTHASRTGIAPDSKRRVGARAAQLITPGSTVILDGGTTALEVIAALSPDLDATIITHSPTTATALASHPRVNVFMLGGPLLKRAVTASGAAAAEAATSVTADLALLSPAGIHPAEGITEPEEAALSRILISRAADTYVLASTEKLGAVCAYKVTGVSELAGIITDAPDDHPTVQQLRDLGVTIIAALNLGKARHASKTRHATGN